MLTELWFSDNNLLHTRHRNEGQTKMGKTCPRTSWDLHWLQRNDSVNQQHIHSPSLLES